MYYETSIFIDAGSWEQFDAASRSVLKRLGETLPNDATLTTLGGYHRPRYPVKYGSIQETFVPNLIKKGLGPALDFALGGYFQYLADSQNPYLTTGQIAKRSVVSGAGDAFFSWGAVAFICGASGGIGCAVFAGVGGGIAWSFIGQPIVFWATGLDNISRDLAVLTP